MSKREEGENYRNIVIDLNYNYKDRETKLIEYTSEYSSKFGIEIEIYWGQFLSR